MNKESKAQVIYKCTAPRPNGGICGFETNNPEVYCPHDNVIVSSGIKYVPEIKQKVCSLCKQPIIEVRAERPRMATTANYSKPIPKEDPSPKAKPAQLVGSEMQKESDPGHVRGQVFR